MKIDINGWKNSIIRLFLGLIVGGIIILVIRLNLGNP